MGEHSNQRATHYNKLGFPFSDCPYCKKQPSSNRVIEKYLTNWGYEMIKKCLYCDETYKVTSSPQVTLGRGSNV